MSLVKKPVVKYRKDYQPSEYLIDSIDLYFDLNDELTTVTSRMMIRQNPIIEAPTQVLSLDGIDLVLKYIKIDDRLLTSGEYKIIAENLILINVPENFLLEIQTEIKPQNNTVLMGLYQSRGIYCTQCESEGFRRMTYYLDRPDVLSKFTTTICADKKRYPILLSNGNLVNSNDVSGGRHWVKWADPFLKPCYLFALVAGDLEFIEDYFTTRSGRNVTLRIFCEKGNRDKCFFAMEALKKAMKWDEEKYGREYDLNLFMIFVVDDFNVGAMENKGLNIFNSKVLFATPDISTDADCDRVASVVAHEYFHNWTGNRVTCRDWFQLSLKEGLTVYRDQTFSEDLISKAVTRIHQVQRLRDLQFPEDAGPLAHSVRPDSYMEIDNFYTMTVYEKGAEVIRMMRNIVGEQGFRKGMDLYFERHDGEAVTCDDFVKAIEDANEVDLTQFKLWYSQAGTPELFVTDEYDKSNQRYQLTVKQFCPKTPNQNNKQPMVIPLSIALLNKKGEEIQPPSLLTIKNSQETFIFENISEKPTLSLLRDFSSPVKCHYDYHEDDLRFLMGNDTDPFACWEAGQHYAERAIKLLMASLCRGDTMEAPKTYIDSIKQLLNHPEDDVGLTAQMLTLPSETYLSELANPIDPDIIFAAREFLHEALAKQLKEKISEIYFRLNKRKKHAYTVQAVAERSLKNCCLDYLIRLNNIDAFQLCVEQYRNANNLNDKYIALSLLVMADYSEKDQLLNEFYETYKNEPLLIDKWFTMQAMSRSPNALQQVKNLLHHSAFNIKNPNRVRSLLVAFAKNNLVRFHDISGEGYALLMEQVLRLDAINPHMSSRVVEPLTRWKRYDDKRKSIMHEYLQQMNKKKLSKNLYEIVSKSLDENDDE